MGDKKKTHCPKGHELKGKNIVWMDGRTRRECRICKYRRNREFYKRKIENYKLLVETLQYVRDELCWINLWGNLKQTTRENVSDLIGKCGNTLEKVGKEKKLGSTKVG